MNTGTQNSIWVDVINWKEEEESELRLLTRLLQRMKLILSHYHTLVSSMVEKGGREGTTTEAEWDRTKPTLQKYAKYVGKLTDHIDIVLSIAAIRKEYKSYWSDKWDDIAKVRPLDAPPQQKLDSLEMAKELEAAWTANEVTVNLLLEIVTAPEKGPLVKGAVGGAGPSGGGGGGGKEAEENEQAKAAKMAKREKWNAKINQFKKPISWIRGRMVQNKNKRRSKDTGATEGAGTPAARGGAGVSGGERKGVARQISDRRQNDGLLARESRDEAAQPKPESQGPKRR